MEIIIVGHFDETSTSLAIVEDENIIILSGNKRFATATRCGFATKNIYEVLHRRIFTGAFVDIKYEAV